MSTDPSLQEDAPSEDAPSEDSDAPEDPAAGADTGPGLRLHLSDGTRVGACYDDTLGWYVVNDRRPQLGDAVVMEGIEREVVLVAELPAESRVALLLLPDFNQPGCEACRDLSDPPTAAYCRFECAANRG